jgi:hypothetical protein
MPCQTMLGGLLMMLKIANLKIGERFNEKGVWVSHCQHCRRAGARHLIATHIVFVGCDCLREDV